MLEIVHLSFYAHWNPSLETYLVNTLNKHPLMKHVLPLTERWVANYADFCKKKKLFPLFCFSLMRCSIFVHHDSRKLLKIASISLLTVCLESGHPHNVTLGKFQSQICCTGSQNLVALPTASGFIINEVCVQRGRGQALFYGFIGMWLSGELSVSHSISQHHYEVILIRLPSSVILSLVPLGWTVSTPMTCLV